MRSYWNLRLSLWRRRLDYPRDTPSRFFSGATIKSMEALRRPLRTSEYLLLFAGIGHIVAQPWLDGPGHPVWVAAKFAYVLGVVLYIAKK